MRMAAWSKNMGGSVCRLLASLLWFLPLFLPPYIRPKIVPTMLAYGGMGTCVMLSPVPHVCMNRSSNSLITIMSMFKNVERNSLSNAFREPETPLVCILLFPVSFWCWNCVVAMVSLCELPFCVVVESVVPSLSVWLALVAYFRKSSIRVSETRC